MKILATLFLLVLAVSGAAFGDTTRVAAGNISGVWTADHSPYMIEGTVEIQATDSLTIGSGVTVSFTGPYRLNVRGALSALGTAEDSVRFTSAAQIDSVRWRAIRFNGAAARGTFLYTVLENSRAVGSGDERYGGVMEIGSSSVIIRNCALRSNGATIDGGAIYARDNAQLTVEASLFENNMVSSEGGGALMSRFSRVQLLNCVFRHNRSLQAGGAVLCFGNRAVEASGCSFIDNFGRQGGAVHVAQNGVFRATQCRFGENIATASGGVCFQNTGTVELTNCILSGNSASNGGGMYLQSGNSTLEFCTFAGQSADTGAILSLAGAADTLHATVVNSILAGSTGGAAIYTAASHPLSVRHTCSFDHAGGLFGGMVPDSIGVIQQINLNGDSCDYFENLFFDPLLVDLPDGVIALADSSPCIAAGDFSPVLYDYLNGVRPAPARSIPDLGAVEHASGNGISAIGGSVSGTVGPGVVLVLFSNVMVDAGRTLTIRPGTRFEFIAPAFDCRGILQAIGTATDSIIFTPSPRAPDQTWSGLYLNLSGPSAMEYCVIEQVSGPDAAALTIVVPSDLRMSHCSIRQNEGGPRGVVSIIPGAGGLPGPLFEDCLFSDNLVHGDGVVSASARTNSTFRRCRFEHNRATGFGGALRLSGCSAVFEECRFIHNSAIQGGAVYAIGSQHSLAHCVLDSNSATSRGGGLYVESADPVAQIRQSTLAGNTAPEGAGIYLYEDESEISSCIVAGNSGSGVFFTRAGALQNFHYTDVFGNSGGDIAFQNDDPLNGPEGIGLLSATNARGDSCDRYFNIALDPQFAPDYHLTVNSPCINTGDLRLPADPDRTTADMGALFYPMADFHAPEAFDLALPQDEDSVDRGIVSFCWYAAHDRDPGDVVTYRLYLRLPDSLLVLNTGADTCLSVDLNAVPFGGATQAQWSVEAASLWPDTSIASLSSFRFFLRPLGVGPGREAPLQFAFHGGYPNPFNATTILSFDLPQGSPVRLLIYDVTGRRVTTLIDQFYGPGRHTTVWNAEPCPSGLYFACFESSSTVQIRKLILLK